MLPFGVRSVPECEVATVAMRRLSVPPDAPNGKLATTMRSPHYGWTIVEPRLTDLAGRPYPPCHPGKSVALCRRPQGAAMG
jgi:hypothetical protein